MRTPTSTTDRSETPSAERDPDSRARPWHITNWSQVETPNGVRYSAVCRKNTLGGGNKLLDLLDGGISAELHQVAALAVDKDLHIRASGTMVSFSGSQKLKIHESNSSKLSTQKNTQQRYGKKQLQSWTVDDKDFQATFNTYNMAESGITCRKVPYVPTSDSRSLPVPVVRSMGKI
jgi:hypothetical protein